MRKLVFLAIVFIALNNLNPIAVQAREYVFQQGDSTLRFNATRTPNGPGYYFQLPGETHGTLQLRGIYALRIKDMIQSQDGSIYLIRGWADGYEVAIWNGMGFHVVHSIHHMVVTRPKVINGHLVIYPLLPVNGEDRFTGLLVFDGHSWTVHEYSGEERSSADTIAVTDYNVTITHNAWGGGTPEVTHFDIRNQNFH